MKALAVAIRALATTLLIAVIRVYRAGLGPFFGPSCRFEPSCSAYTEECLRVHGPLRGAWLGASRIARCHPFSTGGLDPVPAPRPRPAAGATAPAEATSFRALQS